MPSFLIWHELFQILDNIPSASIEKEDTYQDDLENDLLYDGCLSVRILHSPVDSGFQFLPGILEKNGLTLSESTSLYKLGYVDKLINEEHGIPAKSETELDAYFQKWADQPFVNQMLYETNLLNDEKIIFSSNILGCMFRVIFNKDKELYWAAETLMAFFEGILGTSLSGVVPGTESIIINLIRNTEKSNISFKSSNNSSNEFTIELNSFESTVESGKQVWEELIMLFAEMMGKNFFFKDAKTHLDNLFKDEEVHERLGLLHEHRKFSISVLGNSPKFFLSDWIKGETEFPQKRTKELKFKKASETKKKSSEEFTEDQINHTQRKVSSVINNHLWDQAKWEAFGSFFQENGFFGLFIGFANGNAGRKIFEEWLSRFGKEDKDDKIRICIIKGIDKKNPYSYRVLITAKLNKEEFVEGSLVYTTIRIHEMVPNSSKTLDDLIRMYNKLKYFVLIPAQFDKDTLKVKPSFDLGILKKELSIRNAWEIGEHDPDMPGIKKNDDPIIPSDEINPPIKKLLERLKKEKR